MADDARNIGALLQDLAQVDPGEICVEQDGKRYARAEILASAEGLTKVFKDLGVKPCASVAILAADPLRGIEAMIALWSLEVAVLFLDPRQTMDDVRATVSRAEIDYVATDSPGLARKGGFTLLPLRGDATGSSDALTFPPGSEDSNALILSSSGTTGVPRFRRQSHRFFVEGIRASARLLKVPSPKSAAIVGSLAFGAILGHWIRLMIHGQFILSLPLFFRPQDLHAALSRPDVRTVGLPPVVIRDLLDYHTAARTEADGPIYPHLERLSSIGGPIAPHDLVRAYRILTPGVHNLYSMSGVGAVSNLSGEDVLRKPNSVGKPFDEVTVRIVDDAQRDLLAGQIGRIVATPSWKPGAQPVDSGDLGWVDEDGYLMISGRAAQMACRNSINVNLADLELDVKRIDGVRDCIAFSTQAADLPDDEIFLAVEALAEPDRIKAQIRSAIASYRRPDMILIKPALPRNASNKIALCKLQSATKDEDTGFVDF